MTATMLREADAKARDFGALVRAHEATRVLSVYIDGSADAHAAPRSWRDEIDRDLFETRSVLSTGTPDRDRRFERAVAALRRRLAFFGQSLRAPGWAAFVAADGILHEEFLPERTATCVSWATGLHITPYIASTREARPVLLVVVARDEARVYRFVDGVLERQGSVARSSGDVDGLSEEVAGSHVDGQAMHGMSTRRWESPRTTVGSPAPHEIIALAVAFGSDSAVTLVAGEPTSRAVVARMLESGPHPQVIEIGYVAIDASRAEVTATVQSCARAVRDDEERRMMDELEVASTVWAETFGEEAVQRALRQRRAGTVLFTARYADLHRGALEQSLHAAIDQGAIARRLHEGAADRLDARGGVGVRYRRSAGDPRTIR